MKLNIENENFYRQNGFLILRKFFDIEKINKVKASLLACARRSTNSSGGLFNQLKVLKNNPNCYVNLLKSFAKSDEVQRLFFCEETIAAVNSLGVSVPSFCTHPVTNIVSEDLRIRDFDGSPYHQDWPSIQGSLNAVAIWIPLTNIQNNYPLEILPKSHQRGVFPAKDLGRGFPEIILSQEDRKKLIAPVLEPGDIIFFSVFTVHGTKPTSDGSSGFRFAITGRFDDMADKFFIENNYYCAYKRSVDRQIYKMPSKEDIELSNKGRYDVI